MKNINLIISVIDSPVKIAIYKNKKLSEIIKFNETDKTSDLLPIKIKEILDKYGKENIESIVYTNTPGSFMAIKVAYLFLKTISIAMNIKILAIDGFYLNQNKPIKAIGKMHFIKNLETQKTELVATIKLNKNDLINSVKFPEIFNSDDFSDEIEPIYNLPAV